MRAAAAFLFLVSRPRSVRLPSVRVSVVELQPRVPRVLRLRAQVAVPRQRPALHQLVR